MYAKPTPPPPQAFDDVLARMMQAEVNEGGPPPATPCDTPVQVVSQIHMTDPRNTPQETRTPCRSPSKSLRRC